MVEDFIIKDNTIIGIKTENNQEFLAKSVVLTSGTFLKGVIHIGNESHEAGRIGEKSPLINYLISCKNLTLI